MTGKTPEGIVEKYLKKCVFKMRGRIRKVRWVGNNGAPDRVVWWRMADMSDPLAKPLVFFVELKSAKGRISAKQKQEHEKLLKDGFDVVVLDSKYAVDCFITEALYVMGRTIKGRLV